MTLETCTVGNRDGQPTLVVAPFGRAVAKLSRKGRRLSHVMLTDSWEVNYIEVYRKFLPVLHLNKS